MELKVLFADDEEDIRMLMANVFEVIEVSGLEDLAISATIVDDGDVAVEKAREQEYDMFITDIRMPNMNGKDAVKEVKQLQPDIYVIFATGYVEKNMDAIQELGDSVIKKPYSYIDLQDAFTDYCAKKGLVPKTD